MISPKEWSEAYAVCTVFEGHNKKLMEIGPFATKELADSAAALCKEKDETQRHSRAFRSPTEIGDNS